MDRQKTQGLYFCTVPCPRRMLNKLSLAVLIVRVRARHSIWCQAHTARLDSRAVPAQLPQGPPSTAREPRAVCATHLASVQWLSESHLFYGSDLRHVWLAGTCPVRKTRDSRFHHSMFCTLRTRVKSLSGLPAGSHSSKQFPSAKGREEKPRKKKDKNDVPPVSRWSLVLLPPLRSRSNSRPSKLWLPPLFNQLEIALKELSILIQIEPLLVANIFWTTLISNNFVAEVCVLTSRKGQQSPHQWKVMGQFNVFFHEMCEICAKCATFHSRKLQ